MTGFKLAALIALACSSLASYGMLCVWLWMDCKTSGQLSTDMLRKSIQQSCVAGAIFFLVLLIALPLMLNKTEDKPKATPQTGDLDKD